jgi:hypothetical protein
MTDAVRLTGQAREVALAEAQAVVAAGGSAAGLVAEVDEGEVVDELETLEQVLELGLQTGRIRALYGPGGEQAALGVYRRLPHGAAVAESAREVTAALSVLEGRELGSIELRAVGPGAFALSLSADGVELSLHLDRQGARVASAGV